MKKKLNKRNRLNFLLDSIRNNKLLFFIILIIFIILFILISYPYIYDFFVGDKVVEKHLQEVYNNISGAHETALLAMNWLQENVRYPRVEDKIFLFITSNGFYKVDNRTRLFLRSNSASWVIKTKIGRCGEMANYFVEIMNKKGYMARKIKTEPLSWDHVWAEYYDENGNKIIVDPSANKVIINKAEFIKDKNITKIIAEDIKGNKEDITLEYKGGK